MKKLIMIMLFGLTSLVGYSQTFPAKTTGSIGSVTRGTYGTYASIGYINPVTIATIVSGTVTPTTRPDTLKSPVVVTTGYGTDTGYIQFSCSSVMNKTFELQMTVLTGTLAGAAVLLGSKDGQIWNAITGNTTYCAGCIGASASLSGAGTTAYQWYVPATAENYPYHQIRVITSGTCTATFTGTQMGGY